MLEFLRGPMTTSTTKVLFGRPVTGYFDKRISDRKSRLFGCACCRRFWHLLDEEHCRRLIDYGRSFGSFEGQALSEPPWDACRRAVELAERSVDEEVSADEPNALSDAVLALYYAASDYCACYGEEVGPFDGHLVASGHAACAVHEATRMRMDPFSGRQMEAFEGLQVVLDWAEKAAGYCRSTRQGEPSEESASEEQAAQCVLLRDVVGNPFRPVALDPSWLTPAVVSLARTIYEERAFDRIPEVADELEKAGCNDIGVLSHCREQGPHVRGCWLVDLILGKE